MAEIDQKRKNALNYLLAQIFATNDYNELEQQLAQIVIDNKESEPFIEKAPISEEQKQINYPGFTGKRFTALQSKIAKQNENKEEVTPDAGRIEG